MKKIFSILLIVILLVLALYIFGQNSVPTDLEQANVSDATENKNATTTAFDIKNPPAFKNVSFSFTGYGPAGKFENGTFDEFEVEGVSVAFKTNSVNTGKDKLNEHLCAPDFFDCQKYPEIRFTAESVSKNESGTYNVTGSLSFRDIKKQINFNVNSVNDQKFNADFILDTTEFNFNPKLVENRVRISFSFEI